MIADYMDSLTTYGAGFYRNLFSEAGMVGHVLYLEAEEAGTLALVQLSAFPPQGETQEAIRTLRLELHA
jgi:hypothetical protein